MEWFLFIDDERYPTDAVWVPTYIYELYKSKNWVICRNKNQVINAFIEHNNVFPSFCSFDHDLGLNEPTGYDIICWMIDSDISGTITIPENAVNDMIYVHSMNPVGKKNIEGIIDSYMRFKNEN